MHERVQRGIVPIVGRIGRHLGNRMYLDLDLPRKSAKRVDDAIIEEPERKLPRISLLSVRALGALHKPAIVRQDHIPTIPHAGRPVLPASGDDVQEIENHLKIGKPGKRNPILLSDDIHRGSEPVDAHVVVVSGTSAPAWLERSYGRIEIHGGPRVVREVPLGLPHAPSVVGTGMKIPCGTKMSKTRRSDERREV